MAISQTITAFPPAPNAGSDTPEEFSDKADAFVAHQSDNYTPEVNQWATQANSTASDVNNDATTSGNNASNAASSAVLSSEWAENPEDVPVEPGQFSALHWAAKASTFNPASYVLNAGDTMTGNLEAPSMSIGGDNIDIVDYGIESGTNANGEYTKYPDGTMVCTGSDGLSIAISTANGSIYISEEQPIAPFPQTFTEIYYSASTYLGTIPGYSGSNIWVVGTSNYAQTGELQNWQPYKLASSSIKTITGGRVRHIAVGRWK